jgi:peroxin-19
LHQSRVPNSAKAGKKNPCSYATTTMTEPSIAADDLDAMLDDALDELDDSDSDSDDNGETDNSSRGIPQQQTNIGSAKPDTATTSAASQAAKGKDDDNNNNRVPFGPPRPPPRTAATEQQQQQQHQAMDDTLRRMFRDLAAGADLPPETTTNDESAPTETTRPATTTTPQTKSPKPKTDKIPSTGDDEKILKDLFQGLMAEGGDSAAGGMPDMDEIPDLDNLFAGLDGGQGGGTDDFMNGMMEQLLSKELMYEPMKQVTQKFPSWLETKKDELSPEEWDQRNRQYSCFQRLIEAYEGDESGHQTSKLLDLMQEVQEYGQPPPEIINEIAPGLELDGEGLPKMNGMPPFLGGNPGEEECRIM